MNNRSADVSPGSLWAGIVCILAAFAVIGRMCFLDGTAGRMSGVALTILLYGVFCFSIFLRHRRRRQETTAWQKSPDGDANSVLVVFASQTGFAAQLAWQTAESLSKAELAVSLTDIAQLDAARLNKARRVLFIVSTTGEGDAPDSATGFARKVMGVATRFNRLSYAILALGDRRYTHYCAFGHELDTSLRHHGAKAMFDVVEVDNGDEDALRHWQHLLGVLSGDTAMADWRAPRYETWRLMQRELLNPGSMGGATYHLVLTPPAGATLRWQAGDIAEIAPCNAPAHVDQWLQVMQLDAGHHVIDQGQSCVLGKLLSRKVLPETPAEQAVLRTLSPQALIDCLKPLPYRTYSIASLPDDGQLELLVRRAVMPDGRLGLGSGWLTSLLADGGQLDIRVREHRRFHPPLRDVPMILIGNGTGIAGLRAHLKARVAASRRNNWLLFGERSAAHDFFFQNDIDQWLADGMLQRVDLAFSRDQSERMYVQDKLRLAADELRRWVTANAFIYVCGSLDGMATGVTEALHSVLGGDVLASMTSEGRCRWDVY